MTAPGIEISGVLSWGSVYQDLLTVTHVSLSVAKIFFFFFTHTLGVKKKTINLS